MFYGVYYYETVNVYGNGAQVRLCGYYKTLDEAIERLRVVIPNFVKGYRNSVHNYRTGNSRCDGGGRTGWINEYCYGDINNTETSCDQPCNSVNVFGD